MLQCLYNLDNFTIAKATNFPYWNPNWIVGLPSVNDTISPLSIVDGVVIPQSLDDALASGNVIDVPMIIGNLNEE